MKNTLVLFAGILLAGISFSLPTPAGEVRASIEGVNSAKGHVLCAIFQSAAGFPREAKRAFKVLSLTASPAGVVCAFSGLPVGTYAVSVFHDENDDGVLNTTLIGLPREGYGVSNNHTYAMKPPSFEESQFTINAQSPTELHIRLKY